MSKEDPVPLRTRFAVYQRDAYECQYCGVALAEFEATVDHITPESHGGGHCETNLRTCCSSCNSRKGTHSLEHFRRLFALSRSRYVGIVSIRQYDQLVSAGVAPELPHVQFHFEVDD